MSTPTFEELLARIERGENPADVADLLAPADMRVALRHAARLRWLDSEVWTAVVQPRSGATVNLKDLCDRGQARWLPHRPGRALLDPATRTRYLQAWSDDDDRDLADFSAALARHFHERGDHVEAIYHLVIADPTAATEQFVLRYAAADDRFDLAGCEDLLDVLRAPEHVGVLTPALAALLQDRLVYLRSRARWSNDHFRSAGFLERPSIVEPLRRLIESDEQRAVQIFARGGMGKTMLLRWLIARWCIPNRIPCARIDFDEINPAVASRHPWLVLVEVAEQLDDQIGSRPFGELLADYRPLLPALRRTAGREASAAASQLASIASRPDYGDDVIDRFASALASAGIERGVIVLDTLEEVLLRTDLTLAPLLATLTELYQRCRPLRLLLSGRYDLRERGPLASVLAQPPGIETIELSEFSVDEARRYLAEIRQVAEAAVTDAILSKGDLLPFTLAVYGDLVRQHPSVSAADIEEFDDPKLLYLIERVVERIHDDGVKWLLRYGVVPRTLSRDFVEHVMRPYVVEALTTAPRADDPSADGYPRAATAFPVASAATSPDVDIDIDSLWQKLLGYAADYSWVSLVAGSPGSVNFHGDVRIPMRLVLERQKVLRLLHRDAADYFAGLARSDPARRLNWAQEAVYHHFYADGPDAEAAWAALLDEIEVSGGVAERVELARTIVANPDFSTEDGTRSQRWFADRPLVADTALVAAHLEVAYGLVRIATERDLDPANPRWSTVEASVRAVPALLARAVPPIPDPPLLLVVRAALLERDGHADGARQLLDLAEANEKTAAERLAVTESKALLEARTGGAGADRMFRRAISLAAGVRGEAGQRRLRCELGRHLLDSGRVGSARDEVIRAAVPHQPAATDVTELLARIDLALGEGTRAAELIDALDPIPATSSLLQIRSRLSSLLPAGPATQLVIDRAQRTLRQALVADAQGQRSGASAEPGQTGATSQDTATYRAAIAEMIGRVAAALGEGSAASSFETSAHQYREAGRPDDECRAWCCAASLHLHDLGRLHDVDQYLKEAERTHATPGSEGWMSMRLYRAEWLDRRNEGDAARRIHDTLLHDLRARNSPVRLLVHVSVAALSRRNEPTPDPYLDGLALMLEAFHPKYAALTELDGLTRCASGLIPDRHRATRAFRLVARSGEREQSADPNDAAVRLLRLAELHRVLGDERRAGNALASAAELTWDPSSLVGLRLIEANGRLGVGRITLRNVAAHFQQAHSERLVLLASVLVADARCRSDARGDAALAEVDGLLGEPRPRRLDAEVLELRAAAAARDDDLPRRRELLRSAGRLYEQLGDLAAASSITADLIVPDPVGTESPALVSGEHVEHAPLSRGPSPRSTGVHALRVEMVGTDHVSVQRIWPAGGRRSVRQAGRLAATGSAVAADNRDIVGWLADEPDNFASTVAEHLMITAALDVGDASLIVSSPRLVGVPWEMGWRGNGVLHRVADDRDVRYASAIIMRAQRALGVLGQHVPVDGVDGPATRAAVTKFQHDSGLRTTGDCDRSTERALAQSLRSRPSSVVVLRRRLEHEWAEARGHRAGTGTAVDDVYARAGHAVVVVDDPTPEQLDELALRMREQVSVIHIEATLEHLGGSVALAFRHDAGYRQESTFGVESLYTTALDRFIGSVSTGFFPIVVIDAVAPTSSYEAALKLLLRNQLASDLFALGRTPALLAFGPFPSPLDRAFVCELIANGLAGGATDIGELWSQLRRSTEAHAYQSESLVDGAAIFAHDPSAFPLRAPS